MATSNESSKSFDFSLGNKWMRVFWLAMAGIAGFALFKCLGEPILNLLDIAKVGDGKGGYPANARGYLVLPILSLFVVFALWVFRTYDARQQIEQTNRQLQQAGRQAKRQLQQANFAKGLDNLVGDDPLQVDIGVILLLEVSKETSDFDKEIRLAFIKRLKELPGKLGKIKPWEMCDNKLSYAQYIMQWLIDHPKEDDVPLKLMGMDCRYQEFTSKRLLGNPNKKLELVEILSKSLIDADEKHPISGVSFADADCENISFRGVNVSGCDFTNAVNVDITGGYIGDWLPHGLDRNQISSGDLNPQTGEVLKNPDWAKPTVWSDEHIRVRQEKKQYTPEQRKPI